MTAKNLITDVLTEGAAVNNPVWITVQLPDGNWVCYEVDWVSANAEATVIKAGKKIES